VYLHKPGMLFQPGDGLAWPELTGFQMPSTHIRGIYITDGSLKKPVLAAEPVPAALPVEPASFPAC